MNHKKWYVLKESRRIIDMVKGDIDESIDRLKKSEDDPMLAVWTRCARCGHPYENYLIACSRCGRKYD